MTAAIAAPDSVVPTRVPATGWLAATVGLAVAYLVFQENGAVLAQQWEMLHELFHDGRHAFGVPCH